MAAIGNGFINAMIAILVVFAILLLSVLGHTVYTRFIVNRKSEDTGNVDDDVLHGKGYDGSTESNPVAGGDEDDTPAEYRSYDTDFDDVDGIE